MREHMLGFVLSSRLAPLRWTSGAASAGSREKIPPQGDRSIDSVKYITFRPLRAVYVIIISVVAVAQFGWSVLVPLCLIQLDLELKK